jgi:arylsulfatase A-like enzyme
MPGYRITRRKFLGGVAATAAGAAAAGVALHRRKRNVILIISDSVRRDALGCYGGTWVETPRIDEFARTAVRCDNAYLASFPTVPARHDILTGTYSFTYRLWSWMPLGYHTVTLQDVLRPAGVYTALIADTPWPFRPDLNYQRNFDYVHINRGQEDDPYRTEPKKVRLPCDVRKLRAGATNLTQYLRNVADRKTEEDYFCARTMLDAAAWLESSHGRQPFFLYVDTYDPHEPWDPPRYYIDRYDRGYRGEEVIYPRYDRWRDFLSEAELRHCRALYAAEATMADHWVGHLLDKIGELGLWDNTLVLYVSDHGTYLGEHEHIGKFVVRPGQQQMLPLYSELCRVPLLAHFPGCEPGTVLEGLAQPANIPTTVLDFLGVKPPPAFAAPSLWPMLRGKEAAVADVVVSAPTLAYLGMKKPEPANRASVTDGRWLLVYGSAESGDPNDRTSCIDADRRLVAPLTGKELAPELYDLTADPGCVNNVIADHKDRARDLHRALVAFLEHSPMFPQHVDLFRRI